MNLYSEELRTKLQEQIPGYKSMHEDVTRGRIGFLIGNKIIEMNHPFAESADQDMIIDIVKAFSRANASMRAQHESVVSAKIKNPIPNVSDPQHQFLPEGELSERFTKMLEERKMATYNIDKANKHLEEMTKKTEKKFLDVSAWRAEVLLHIAKEYFATSNIKNSDPSSINVQNEKVYSRDILFGRQKIGQIEYLEDSKKVTILRSDIDKEHQNQGFGFNAYKSFINEKLAIGKSVGSDSILSPQAQRLYQKLEEAGYKVRSAPTRLLSGGKRTTIDREDIIQQRNSVPLMYVEGARVSVPGYRMKGPSAFTILPLKEPKPDLRAIHIAEIDKKTRKEVLYTLTEDSLSKSVPVKMSKAISSEQEPFVYNLLRQAEYELLSSDNKGYRTAIKNLSPSASITSEISLDSLERVLAKELEDGFNY